MRNIRGPILCRALVHSIEHVAVCGGSSVGWIELDKRYVIAIRGYRREIAPDAINDLPSDRIHNDNHGRCSIQHTANKHLALRRHREFVYLSKFLWKRDSRSLRVALNL